MENEQIKFQIKDLKSVVMNLLGQNKRKLVFELLDLHFKRAKTIEDFDVLGYLSFKSEYRDMYLKCAEAAYVSSKNPQQLYNSRTNLYRVYSTLNEPTKSILYIDINLKINPDDFEAQAQKAYNIALLGDQKTSDEMTLKLLEKYPEKKDKIKNALSGKLLREGKTTEGLLYFLEAYKPKSEMFEDNLKMKKWTGIIQPGKTVYFEGEGGIGDEIINIRFFKYLKDFGMKPVLYSAWANYRQDTINFFRRNGFEVLTEPHSINRKQLWSHLMSLPAYLNLDESKLWYGTYLTPLKNSKNKIKNNKFKIGIKCSGNPYFRQDEYRKIPLDKMLEYLPKDAEIYYIDKEPINDSRVIDLSEKIDSWEDTLDLIDQMDCIVSSCTSLVHAAGAMGKTTFVVVPIMKYYIWTTTRTDTSSPWYGNNFQVHKQTIHKSWNEPLQSVKNEVLKLINEKN
jgi:hypothetical protein